MASCVGSWVLQGEYWDVRCRDSYHQLMPRGKIYSLRCRGRLPAHGVRVHTKQQWTGEIGGRTALRSTNFACRCCKLDDRTVIYDCFHRRHYSTLQSDIFAERDSTRASGNIPSNLWERTQVAMRWRPSSSGNTRWWWGASLHMEFSFNGDDFLPWRANASRISDFNKVLLLWS